MPHRLRPSEATTRRAIADPYFLGHVLACYQQRHRLDDAGLAALLGCDIPMLTKLRLCRRPGADLPCRTAAKDVARMATRFGLAAGRLARVVEEDGDEPDEADATPLEPRGDSH
jgi:hypothetical protein